MTPLSALALLFVVLLGLEVLRGRRRQRLQERDLVALRPAAEQALRAAEDESRLDQLMVDLTRLTERLQTARDVREIPQVVVHLLRRTFDADKVLVLFARKSEGMEGRTLVVGATSPGLLERARNEAIRFGEGELGLVAEIQETVNRRDLEERHAERHATVPGLRSFCTDLAAPMVVAGETFGVVALSGVKRHFKNEKTMLTLIAQVTGFGLHSAVSYSELKDMADRDGLTGILNRRALIERLEELVAEALAADTSVGLFMFDLDHFKHYNDRNGHGAGDRVLQEMCTLVSRSIRAEDVLGRLGGEEFVVASPSLTVASSYGLAEKLRRAVEAFPFENGAEQPLGKVTISGGVAVLPGHARDGGELLRQADRALYRAKDAGRNRVEIAVPEPSPAG